MIKLKSRWSDGTTHLRFSGVELCVRLAALVPQPRQNLIRFGGVFAPRHKLRTLVVTLTPKGGNEIHDKITPSSPNASSKEVSPVSPKLKKYALSWNELRARVFEEDLSHYLSCGEKMKITDVILDRSVIIRILTFHDLPTEIPKFASHSRAPPHEDLFQSECSWT